MRRSRLSRKGNLAGDRERLKRSLAQDMQYYSDKKVNELATAPADVRRSDPLVQLMYDVARGELKRRAELRKEWGTGTLKPAGFREALAIGVRGGLRKVKILANFPYRIYSGKLEGDVERASDYFFDKLDDFIHRKQHATERWHQFALSHHLAKRTTTDYIKQGYDIANRFPFDTDPDVLKLQIRRYKARYPSLVVVPTKIDDKLYYDLMIKAKT